MPITYPPVTFPGTEVRMLQSANVDQEFKLFISLPQSYDESQDNYPVLYVTDANWVFRFFHLLGWLAIPPMIVVGIGYPTDDDADIARLRIRDFLPTHDKKREEAMNEDRNRVVESGGARRFLSFIREELFDFIDTQYRTKTDDRTLFGFSWGGTFAIYTLFNHPDTFQRYIISAPDLSWDNQICFSYESEYADKFTDLPVKLYLAVGSLDEDLIEHNFSSLIKFQATVQSRNYPGLSMKLDIFNGETHISSVWPVVPRGLQAVFS